jgi:cyclopropane fatty-acyl-phospholipid synthase-like methyltransferase
MSIKTLISHERYPQDYFKTGNYLNYLCRGERYAALADELIHWLKQILGYRPETMLDYGCGVGFLVQELRLRGVEAFGYDISSWAVAYANEVLNVSFVSQDETQLNRKWDGVIALDVFEHMGLEELTALLMRIQTSYLIARMPIAKEDGGCFVLECSERDLTHKLRLTKDSWQNYFSEANYYEVARPALMQYFDSEGVYCALLEYRGL